VPQFDFSFIVCITLLWPCELYCLHIAYLVMLAYQAWIERMFSFYNFSWNRWP